MTTHQWCWHAIRWSEVRTIVTHDSPSSAHLNMILHLLGTIFHELGQALKCLSVWLSGKGVVNVNKLTLRRSRLVLRLVTVQGLNSVGAGGSWDPTPLTWAPTPYFQAPTRQSTLPRQMCNCAITRTFNRLNSQRSAWTFRLQQILNCVRRYWISQFRFSASLLPVC